ncbi:MAG: hypothetical protein WAX69_18870, partial [Victivallales bacterium]
VPELIILSPFLMFFYYTFPLDTFFPLSVTSIMAVNMFFSYMVWQKALVKGLNPWKIFLKLCIIVSIAAVLFQALMCLIFTVKLNIVEDKACKANVYFDVRKKLFQQVPKNENSYFVYENAFLKLQKYFYDLRDNESMVKLLDDKRWMIQTVFYDYEEEYLRNTMTVEQVNKVGDILADGQEMKSIADMLESANTMKYFKINAADVFTDVKNIERTFFYLRLLGKVNISRIRALAERGRSDECYKSIETGFKIYERMRYAMPDYQGSQYLSRCKCRSVLQIIYLPPDKSILQRIEHYISYLDNFDSPENLKEPMPYALSLRYENTFSELERGSPIRINILRDPYIKNMKAFYLSNILEIINRLKICHIPTTYSNYPWEYNFIEHKLQNYNINPFREDWLYSSMTKLTLSIKAYQIENGEYPQKLEMLPGDVIRKIPDSFKNKFEYLKDKNGFVIYLTNDNIDNGITEKKIFIKVDK